MKDKLKKVTAFEDTTGKIWKTQEEYLKDLEKKLEDQKRIEKARLAEQIVSHVYPRWNKTHMHNHGTYDMGQSLFLLLSTLSFEDLKAVEPYFVKMGQPKWKLGSSLDANQMIGGIDTIY